MARRGLAIIFTLLGIAVFVSFVGLAAMYFLVGRRPSVPSNAVLTMSVGGPCISLEEPPLNPVQTWL